MENNYEYLKPKREKIIKGVLFGGFVSFIYNFEGLFSQGSCKMVGCEGYLLSSLAVKIGIIFLIGFMIYYLADSYMRKLRR